MQSHDSLSTFGTRFIRFWKQVPELNRVLFILPFVSLYLWFRFEQYCHLHPFLIAFWIAIFFALLFVLGRSTVRRSRMIFIALWFGISCFVIWDFVQRLSYVDFSREDLYQKASESTARIKKRALKLLNGLDTESLRLQQALASVDASMPENIPIGMQESIGETQFWWGIYNQEGRLLAWNGQVRSVETFLPDGSREAEVETILHQQWLKLKRSVRIRGVLYMLVAYEPLAADYGIENQYLHGYNRLTDRLPIRPLLLYNSESSARSPDIVVQNLQITHEFKISALYEKSRYQQLMDTDIHRLHWWLEFLSLVLFVFASVYLTFEFIGVSGRQRSKREMLTAWLSFLCITLFIALAVAEFSAFGRRNLFNSSDFQLPGYWGLFRSPGNVLFTAFFSMNLMFSLVMLSRATSLALSWRRRAIAYSLVVAGFIATGVLLGSYFSFMRLVMSKTWLNVVDFSMLGGSFARLAMIFGMLWLDLSLVFLISTLIAFLLRNMSRTHLHLLFVGGLCVLAVASFVWIADVKIFAVWPVFLLCLGIGVLIFYLPRLWPWFERINPLSRFFAVLIFVWWVSFLFHSARARYSTDLQEDFVRRDAAPQILAQEDVVQEMLHASTRQIDEALHNVTLDSRIPDVPYRLWLRTPFARSGSKSALELFEPDGARAGAYSLRFPSLHVNIARMQNDNGWTFQSLVLPLGTALRQIFFAVRRLDNGGYIALEAMEDPENLPFIPSTSPLREVFRPERTAGGYVDQLSLCIFDSTWHPTFVSDPELTPSVEKARTLLRAHKDGWVEDVVNGRRLRAYFFIYKDGAAALVFPTVSLRTRIVEAIDMFLLNLLWLSAFSLILRGFFGGYLLLHFQAESATRFSFYQKLLIAFLVFSMVPMLLLSFLIRNYVWEKKTAEVTSRALSSFSFASRVISDYIYLQRAPRGEIFDDDTLEWIGQVTQQDVSVYFESTLIATSARDFYTAGLLGQRLQGSAYVDLFLKGKKYSFGESQIGNLSYLNVNGRVHRGRFKDEVISIPFLIDRRSVEEEIIGLREYMMLTGAGLILFAVVIGWFLAGRFVRPVRVLIYGASEMSKGNLQYRISAQYRDEFQQLVNAFNSMANSIDEQQQALERRRQYIENILNHITTAVISIDNTMNIATVNPAAAEMLGVDPSSRGLLEDVVSRPGSWPELAAAVHAFLSSPRELRVREVAEYRTNRELHFRLVYVPLFEGREWAGAVLLVEDISDIIQSNRLAAFAEMARRVAHEVKNPLTPIQLAVEHLVRVYKDRSSDFENVLKNCSEAVLKQVKTLRRLVSEFSLYGRPAVLNRVETDLRGFIDEIARSYESLPQGVKMTVSISPDLPRVRIDPDKMRGAIMNIIENGLQAVNGSGTIDLQAESADQEIRIVVQDNGPGVPPEILPRLFEPYFSTKSGGTGLGLAIARKNVEDHGGRITVESTPGKGTRVILSLPALPVHENALTHDVAT